MKVLYLGWKSKLKHEVNTVEDPETSIIFHLSFPAQWKHRAYY